jgi:non-specific protein-tyrosine kinase
MEQTVDLSQYVRILRKWWWLLLACTLVAGGASYYGALQMPRVYQATATVMVGQSLLRANPSGQDIYISQQLAATYAQMVKRQPVLHGAAQALGLEFVPSSGDVTTRLVEGTQLLEISVRDSDRERAPVLADEIARQLILQSPTEGGEEGQRRAFVAEQLADLERNIQATRTEIASEQAKLDAANSARAIQQYQANIAALQTKLSSYQSTYASLLLTVSGGTNYITVVEPARAPTAPISPNIPQTVAVSAALGLLLAALGALAIEATNDTVQDPQDASDITGLPLLASVARMEGEGYAEKLITRLHPQSPISEAFRVLRTNLQFSSVDKPLRSVMVTSPGPLEGKSVTLANLGVVFAEAGLRTLIVDTDLRRPVQHHVFDLDNARGLSDLMVDPAARPSDYWQATEASNLYVLSAGPVPPNPSEILSSQRMSDLIGELREAMDMVLFDSPPALLVADASILGSQVDGVLLVADVGLTRRAMAKRVVDELRRTQTTLVGLVLNRVRSRSGGYYYYYRYGYYYGEGGERRRRHRRRGLARPSTHSGGSPSDGRIPKPAAESTSDGA